MQSQDSISDDRTKSKVAEPCPGATERSVLQSPVGAERGGWGCLGRAIASERASARRANAVAKGPAPGGPGRVALFARETLKTAATLLILALAVLAALVIWDSYVTAPWTRDGSVRAQVANIAPEVSGQITELRVVDNQYVHQGDVLYVIDPFDFQVALDTAKAQLRRKPPICRSNEAGRSPAAPVRPRHDTGGAAAIYRPRRRRRPPSTRPACSSPRPTST